MSSAAPIYDLVIPQGGTFSRTFIWKDSDSNPVQLTNYTGRLQIRTIPSATGKLVDASTTSTGTSYLAITPTAGKVTLTLPASLTAALTFKRAVWDLEVTSSGGTVTRLVQGEAILDHEVTR